MDYYFIYGPEMDQIIHEYRNLTGHTPMLPKWAYGFFQSKDRYVSQDEVLSIAHRYREEHIPLDAIVQDWYWWKTEGDPVFNSNFPDIPAELNQLHDEHVHAMISVWGLFDTKSDNYRELIAQHFDVPNAHVYDATNPKARDFYWDQLGRQAFLARLGRILAGQRRARRILAPHGGRDICATSRLPSATARSTRIYFRSCTLLASSSTGELPAKGSGSSCSRDRPSSASKESEPRCGQGTSSARTGV